MSDRRNRSHPSYLPQALFTEHRPLVAYVIFCDCKLFVVRRFESLGRTEFESRPIAFESDLESARSQVPEGLKRWRRSRRDHEHIIETWI